MALEAIYLRSTDRPRGAAPASYYKLSPPLTPRGSLTEVTHVKVSPIPDHDGTGATSEVLVMSADAQGHVVSYVDLAGHIGLTRALRRAGCELNPQKLTRRRKAGAVA